MKSRQPRIRRPGRSDGLVKQPISNQNGWLYSLDKAFTYLSPCLDLEHF